MRYHHARVVLAACLAAAMAAAQAPGTPPVTHTAPGLGTLQMETRDLMPPGSGLRDEWPSRSSFVQEQDPDPYTLRKVFAEHHLDFMNRRERFDPAVEFRGRLLPNQRVNHEPGSFDMLGYDFDMEAPLLVSPDGYLLIGAFYHGRSYKFSSAFGTQGNAGQPAGDQNLSDETLTATGLRLGFGVFLHENVLFEMETNPGVWSDMDGGLHHEDLDFPSSALFTIRSMDNFFVKIGARYNQVYEDAPWLPIVGFSWEVVESFRMDVLAPEKVEFSFWPSTSTGFLLGGEVTGAEYHVRPSAAVRNNNADMRADLRVQECIVYLGLVSRFNDYVSFSARSGLVVAGDYTLTTGGAGFDPAEGALDQGFFAEISLGFDF